MINRVPYNYNKLNEYKFYHIMLLKNEKKIENFFDKTKDEIIEIINSHNNYDNFIVKGTIDNIKLCLRYVNEKENAGILFSNIQKEDIFQSQNSIFVDLTEYFKNVKH